MLKVAIDLKLLSVTSAPHTQQLDHGGISVIEEAARLGVERHEGLHLGVVELEVEHREFSAMRCFRTDFGITTTPR